MSAARGQVWTVLGAAGYAGKPRPVVIVQDDHFDATDSITVCLLTSTVSNAPLLRVDLAPSALNGLTVTSSIMVDKITTVPRHKLGTVLGRLTDSELLHLNRAILVLLGLAGS